MLPLISCTLFNSDKCFDTVDCANGTTSTISPHTHDGDAIKYCIIANRAGCPKAFNTSDISLTSTEKPIVFVIPISQYYDIDFEKQKNNFVLFIFEGKINSKMTYSIVIPAHNEDAFIGLTLDSIINQTIKPTELIVVDDNSTDNTSKIVAEYAQKYAYIHLVHKQSDASHQPGSKVIQAFLEGFNHLDSSFDFVVKLDADLILPPHYFEVISRHFKSDPTIGIAGGFAYIEKKGKWILENLTSKDHIRGAFKAYLKECYHQIGGLQPAMGWDTADELIARYYGWKITTDTSLYVKHLKPTGANYQARSAYKQGEAFYCLGYGFWLTLIASCKLAVLKKQPSLTTKYIYGYLKAVYHKIPKLVTKDQAQFIQDYRWKIIWRKLKL